MLSAEKEGVLPEAFIEKVKHQHVSDFERFNIGYDHYYSTHSDEKIGNYRSLFIRLQIQMVALLKKIFNSILMKKRLIL